MSTEDASRPVTCADPRYHIGLLERVLLVSCPRCGAAQDERCIGQYGRRTKSCHYVRRDAAKEAGFLMGRSVAARYPQPLLSRVRQIHHELLAVFEMRRV